MVFEVVISTLSEDDTIIGQSLAEFDTLPTPEQIELVCDLVMADAKCAVATVHLAGFASILYGVVVESANYGKKE